MMTYLYILKTQNGIMMATLPVSVIKMHNVVCETHTHFMIVRESSETQRGGQGEAAPETSVFLEWSVCLIRG